jgi:hypothetical protein
VTTRAGFCVPERRFWSTLRRLAGIFFPRPEMTLPNELKRELYDMLSSEVARQLKRRKVSESTQNSRNPQRRPVWSLRVLRFLR